MIGGGGGIGDLEGGMKSQHYWGSPEEKEKGKQIATDKGRKLEVDDEN